MKYIQTALVTSAIALAAGAISSSAWAQDEQEPPVPVPAAPAPEEEADDGPSGFLRLDHDSLGLQFWVGGTHNLGGVDISTDVYVAETDPDGVISGEFDIGPSFSLGPVSLLPMAGIAFDWAGRHAAALVAPQLYTIVDIDPIYFESWILTFVPSVFQDGADNDLYARNFVLFKAGEHFHVGPQVETVFALNNDRDTLDSLQIGGRVNLFYGENDLLGLFLGYETVEDARTLEEPGDPDPVTGIPTIIESDRGAVGRITYVHTW